jgi:MoxR-like ATPase
LRQRFRGTASYITSRDLEGAVDASVTLKRPLLVKGEPGTGKTMLAFEIAAALGMPLIQWHIKSTTKAQQGLYEYDAVSRLRDGQLGDPRVHDIANYIVRGKLWDAFEAPESVVLLIDEVDKADEEFEAFLLELLSDFQVSVPELGTLKAREKPAVILTSNRARELSEALRRRCLHLFIDFPGTEQERRIIELKVPELDAKLAAEAARFVGAIRKLGLRKPPSIAETLDWARALVQLGVRELDTDAVRTALGVLLKHEDDRAKVESKASALAPRRKSAT